MKTLRKIASVIAGGVLLGGSLCSLASATFDQAGLSKSFFYDSAFNPIVQIVVGSNSLGPDSVAAGNIAAVIGNLAYSSQQRVISLDASAEGQVVLGVSASGAVGKYEQADHGTSFTAWSNSVPMIAFDSATNGRSTSEPSSFYKDTEGLNWSNDDPQLYEKGEFVTYSLSCETQRTDAGILKEASYNNIHCLFCETLCLEQLENPEHEMSESIWVDWAKMKWFEDGLNSQDSEALTLKIPSRTVEYRVDTQCIPMEKLEKGNDTVDFEWRGKMLLFGEEYYVKNVKGYDKIYLAKGKILDDVTSEGYTSEYLGYKFKIDHLIYSAEFQVAGILLDVEKPDGTVVQTQISKLANGVVDDIEVAGVYAEEADTVSTASIIAYDRTSDVLLEDGKDIELGGEVKKYWKTSFSVINANSTDDITEYKSSSVTGKCLENLTVQYRHSIDLVEGESLEFPSTFILTFDGYRKSSDYTVVPCSGAGEGNIQIAKVENFIGLMSFTGDDGQRYDNVRIDEGPFETGEMFILDGGLYEYDSYEQDQQTLTNDMKVVLKDLLSGGKTTYRLPAYYNYPDFNSTTYSFEESAENDETALSEVDENINDTDVFIGTIKGVVASWEDGTLAFGDEYLGLDSTMFGTFSRFHDSGNILSMSIVNENGTFDLNKDGNADDRLIVLSNAQGEYAIIDLYDRSYNSSANNNINYKEGVVSTDQWTAAGGVFTTNISGKLDDEDDTMLILPDGGTKITVSYGTNTLMDSFEVCHPIEAVKSTAFIGTGEQEIMLEAVITKDDEGKEQTVGCCTYTVKEFSVNAVNPSETVNEITLSNVEGGLVVSDVDADLSKNLVIVGGPAVNSLSTVTAEQLDEADDQYIVLKDGSKLIVAGYDAKDTVAAGNALIKWLRENAHA